MNWQDEIAINYKSRLKTVMRERKITVAQLSENTGLSQFGIYNILNQGVRGNIATWLKIADALDVGIEELVVRVE